MDAIARLLHLDRFDQRHALAAPMADGGHHDLVERAFIRPLDARGVGRRKQLSATERQRGKRDVHREIAARSRGRDRLPVARTGNVGDAARARRAPRRSRARAPVAPEITAHAPAASRGASFCHIRASAAVTAPGVRLRRAPTRRRDSRASGLAPRASAWPRASSTRNAPSEPSAMPPAARAPRPARTSPRSMWPPDVVEQQQILALAVVRAADQRDVALSGGDARERDAHGVDAGRLLAHEGARGAGDAVHDRDVAGEQVGELRQEQRRPQVAHQPFVEEGVGIGGLAQAGEDRCCRPRCRARRRRPRRSCPCARAARHCP